MNKLEEFLAVEITPKNIFGLQTSADSWLAGNVYNYFCSL